EGKAVRHLTIKEDLQRVVARGSSALVHVDEVVAEKRAHRAWIDANRSWRRNQVRRAPIVDKVGDGGLIDCRNLIDVAVAAKVNLTRTYVIDFQARSRHELILDAQAVLIALRTGIALFQDIELHGGLRRRRIERRGHRGKGDPMLGGIVIEWRQL